MREKRLRRVARNGQCCETSELLTAVMWPPVNGLHAGESSVQKMC